MLKINPRADDDPIGHIFRRLLVMGEKDQGAIDPQFSGQTVLVASDYGKDIGAKSGYSHNTVLLMDWNAAAPWWEEQKRRRASDHWKGVGTFEFKRLNKKSVVRRLPSFLELADLIPGLVVSVVVNTRFRDLLGDRTLAKQISDAGLGEFKSHIAEKLLRAVTLPLPWVGIHAQPGQKIFWISDEDALTQDMESLGKMWSNAIDFYFDGQLTNRGIAVLGSSNAVELFQDDGKMMTDLMSVADLFGGAVTEYSEQLALLGGGALVKEATDVLTRWGAGSAGLLKKQILRIEPNPDGSVRYAFSTLALR